MEINGITLKEDDILLGVDFTNGKDITVMTMNMTVKKFNELQRLAEIGAAVEWSIADSFEFVTESSGDLTYLNAIDLKKLLDRYRSECPRGNDLKEAF